MLWGSDQMFGCSNMLCLLASTWYQRVYGCPAYAKQSLSSAWLTKHKNVTSFSTSFLKPKVKSIKKNHLLHDEPYQWKFYFSLLTFIFYPCKVLKVFMRTDQTGRVLECLPAPQLCQSPSIRAEWETRGAPSAMAKLHSSRKQCTAHNGKYSN